jgi:hypothetical protein
MLATVRWVPEEKKPEEAPEIERKIDALAPACQVKVHCTSGEWLVRALAPAIYCGRGRTFADRDVSERIAELLRDEGYRART